MCSLVMSLCSRDVITIIFNGSRLTGLTCSKAPGFWMVEHQLVYNDLQSIFTTTTIGSLGYHFVQVTVTKCSYKVHKPHNAKLIKH